MESLNSNAAYLSESLQPLPYTPFAALMARKTNNESAAVQDTRPTEPVKIGVLGKSYVKEVSYLLRNLYARMKQCVMIQKIYRFDFTIPPNSV